MCASLSNTQDIENTQNEIDHTYAVWYGARDEFYSAKKSPQTKCPTEQVKKINNGESNPAFWYGGYLEFIKDLCPEDRNKDVS